MKLNRVIMIHLLLIVYTFSATSMNQEIHRAALEGNVSKVKELLEKDPGLLKSRGSHNDTLLHSAVKGDSLDLVKFLLDLGASKDKNNGQYKTPIFYSVIYSDLNMFKLLLTDKTNLNKIDSGGRTLLHYAASNGKKDIVALLLEKNVDLEIKEQAGNKPINYAVINGHIEIAEMLMNQGSVLRTKGEEGRKMLHEAACAGHEESINMLIKEGVDVHTLNNNGGSLLHSAARGGLRELALKMIIEGKDVNGRNRYGLTPLHLAVSHEKKEVVTLLLEKGADANLKNYTGETPLHYALDAEHEDIIQLLLKKGADNKLRKFPVLKGEYLGQKKPGLNPVIFAPGIVSTQEHSELACTFSPDGKEFFYTLRKNKTGHSQIWSTERKNNIWSAPHPAAFSYDGILEDSPFVTPDGEKFFFRSARPKPGNSGSNNFSNIWVMDREETGWGEPKHFRSGILNISAVNNGSLYYVDISMRREQQVKIMKSKLIGDNYQEAQEIELPSHNLPPGSTFISPFISPDENYLLFSSRNWTRGQVTFNLYVSFRDKNGQWCEPINLEDKINLYGHKTYVVISPDGKYLFFTLNNEDIYWVDAEIIKKTKGQSSPNQGHDLQVKR